MVTSSLAPTAVHLSLLRATMLTGLERVVSLRMFRHQLVLCLLPPPSRFHLQDGRHEQRLLPRDSGPHSSTNSFDQNRYGSSMTRRLGQRRPGRGPSLPSWEPICVFCRSRTKRACFATVLIVFRQAASCYSCSSSRTLFCRSVLTRNPRGILVVGLR